MENYPKFTILAEKLRGRTFEISKAEMSIGSHEDNDICIDDSSVSDHHADIFRREIDGRTVYVLRDNNSLNGTRVNNVMITGEQVLKNSDLVQFSDIEVLFDIDDVDENDGTVKIMQEIKIRPLRTPEETQKKFEKCRKSEDWKLVCMIREVNGCFDIVIKDETPPYPCLCGVCFEKTHLTQEQLNFIQAEQRKLEQQRKQKKENLFMNVSKLFSKEKKYRWGGIGNWICVDGEISAHSPEEAICKLRGSHNCDQTLTVFY